MSDLRLIRGASPSRFGGIHWFEWKPKDEALVGPAAPDLILLHPEGEDGSFFTAIAPLLTAGRTVIAPDYPGSGKSDPLKVSPTVEIYTDAMIDMIRARDTHGPVNLLGYQEGCLVACEISLRYPTEVNRMVLVDGLVPEDIKHDFRVIPAESGLQNEAVTISRAALEFFDETGN
jgi:pimeloyl-ACP methyl ester carboxylesterase